METLMEEFKPLALENLDFKKRNKKIVELFGIFGPSRNEY